MKKSDTLVPTLLNWFVACARDLPWRRTRDPYAIWVSEIMLQQTQVKTVIPYWERWMSALPNLRALAEARPEVIHKLWEGLGYYTRVRNMQKAAQEIIARHGGEFPRAHAAMLELPGIGRYTAGAIASIAFNEPQPILDGNVIRVLTRVFGIAENPREKSANQKLWELAGQLVAAASDRSATVPGRSNVKSPEHVGKIQPTRRSDVAAPGTGALRCSHLNQSLMELGALICTPRQPQCLICPLRGQCVAFRTGRVEQLPNLGARAAATSRHFVAFVMEQRGTFLVRQRAAGQVNAHLWEFPNVETDGGKFDVNKLAQEMLGTKPAAFTELSPIKHTITRYRITLRVFRATHPAKKSAPVGYQWLKLEKLEELAFSSAHRKILRSLDAE